MKNLGILGGMLGAALMTIAACSSSSSSPGGASSSCIASLESAGNAGTTCDSCMNSNCSDQITAASNSCSDYFSCICPNGTYSASATTSQTCTAKLQSQQGCTTAFTNVSSCETQKCASQCSGTSDGGSGSGSGSGGSSGADSGSATALSAACQSYETCCEAYYAANPTLVPAGQTAQSTCEFDAKNASYGGDAACNDAKAAYAANGGTSACQ